ncbi:MAG: dihydropteroate synthase [Candidatus Thorarchaeota archaeon]|jgi:dihydropteroate synthase
MTPYKVRVDNLEIGTDTPARIMGVINLSPESFYPESVVTRKEDVQKIVMQMEKDGADLIDIGGSSSAPKTVYGTSDVKVEVELERVKEGLAAVMGVTNVPVSIDTTSSIVAEAALALGASVINDISGLRGDSKMAELVADSKVPIVLMASCSKPCAGVQQSVDALRESLSIAEKAGIDREQIILDPGVGFGKPAEADYALLKSLRRFTMWGHPVMVGISRKAFIGELLGLADPKERLIGTVAATALAVSRGAKIVRAHDIVEAKLAARMGEELSISVEEREQKVSLYGLMDEKEAEIVIEQIGTGGEIVTALSRKAVNLSFLLRNIKTPAALIIKQEMLALGGDAAYHTDVIDSEIDETDVLVMGTPFQLERFIDKLLKMDYFGLPIVAGVMRNLMNKRMKGLG